MREQEQQTQLGDIFSMSAVSLLFLLVGGIMTFFPTMQILYFSYTICAFLFAGGLALFLRYFVNEEYKNLGNYDFSLGIGLITISVLVLLNAKAVCEHFMFAIGILIFLDAVFFLQYAVQIRMLKKPMWQIVLLFSIIAMVVAWMALLDFQHIFTKNPQILFILLMIFGGLGLLVMLVVYLQLRSIRKAEEAVIEHTLEEDLTLEELVTEEDSLTEEADVSEEAEQPVAEEVVEEE